MVDGKEWEDLFSNLCIQEGLNIVRFYDTLYQYKDVNNACDFVISKGKEYPSILVECKVCSKSSFSFSKFPQLDRLLNLPLFKSFVVIWFVEYKQILAFRVEEVEEMRKNNYKSINPDKVGNIDYVRPISLVTKWKIKNPESLEVKKLWEI